MTAGPRKRERTALGTASRAGPAAIALLLAACSSDTVSGSAATAEAPIVISRQVWAAFQRYVGEGMPGAFAVSRDGRRAQYVYCMGSEAATAGRPCQSAMISQQALIGCGSDCLIFAEGTSIIVSYRVE